MEAFPCLICRSSAHLVAAVIRQLAWLYITPLYGMKNTPRELRHSKGANASKFKPTGVSLFSPEEFRKTF